MKKNNKDYGFTIALDEFPETIPTLSNETLKFAETYPKYLHKDNILKEYLTNTTGDYNLCHFW